MPLQLSRLNVRQLKQLKYWFTGANIRYCHLRLLTLTPTDQADHSYSRNVSPHLLQYVLHYSLYSDSSHATAKIKM